MILVHLMYEFEPFHRAISYIDYLYIAVLLIINKTGTVLEIVLNILIFTYHVQELSGHSNPVSFNE